MQVVERPAELRAQVAAWRRDGARIAFVPTMGNLHAGHLALVAAARQQADRLVTSIFVNPTQFGPDEDLDRYPRTLAADRAQLEAAGCDLLFCPPVDAMYPLGLDARVRVQVPGIADVLEGAVRPGHFDGVAGVVLRLFNLVAPDLAVFGRKDYQQWRVIERLVTDLALPIRIQAAPTSREADGLALSSRNAYLTPAQRAVAPELHRTLLAIREAWRQGKNRFEIERDAQQHLAGAGFLVDYACLRRASDLRAPESGERAGLVALVAARLGGTRLIDNLELDA